MGMRCALFVVNNLGSPMVCGLDVMRALNLKFNLDQKNPLSFQKGIFRDELRSVDAVTLPHGRHGASSLYQCGRKPMPV